MSLSFKRAEQIRLELTAQQQKEIRDLYQSVADDIADRLSVPQRVPSDALQQWYLRDLQKQVNAALEGVGKTTESKIRSNAKKVAQGVVDCNADWLKSVGMPIGGAFSWVPTDIVTSVATGQIYEGPWSLLGAIWADVQTQQRDIQTIIARGIAENKSAFDIAKDLEKYVDPSAVKPWDWSKVYPGVRRVIDYSAQRLARTMVSHAYQQAFVCTTQKNPFVTKYKWEASNSDRVCELCQERDGKLFSKDDLPLDHPNGMCTFTAVIEDSMDQVADRLADWANGKDDPELDTWAKDSYSQDWINPKTSQYSNEMDTKGYVGLSEAESDAFIDKYHNKTLLNKKSMNTMDGAQSRRINTALRKDQMPSDPKDQKFMAKLDTAISKNSLPQDMTLFRGVSLSAFNDFEVFLDFEKLASQVSMDKFRDASGKIDFDAWGKAFETAQQQDMANLLERGKRLLGTVVEDKGFMQVSASSERNIFGFSDVNIQLHAPEGTHAYISDYKEESEIILARGTKYEILDVGISTVKAENGNQMEVLQIIAKIVR